LSLRGIRGVLFDNGSTLVEFENRPMSESIRCGIDEGYDFLIDKFPSLPAREQFTSNVARLINESRENAIRTMKERRATDAAETYFTQLRLTDPGRQSHEFMQVLYRSISSQMTICKDALETLREIKERGLKTGLISNTPYPAEIHEAELEKFGLKSLLDFRIYSSEFGKRKPHPDIFAEGVKRIKLEPGQLAYVGDNYEWDVVGAARAGLKPVLKFHRLRRYPEALPDGISVIHNLKELMLLLDS